MEGGEGRRVEKKVVGVCGREVGGGGGEEKLPNQIVHILEYNEEVHTCMHSDKKWFCLHAWIIKTSPFTPSLPQSSLSPLSFTRSYMYSCLQDSFSITLASFTSPHPQFVKVITPSPLFYFYLYATSIHYPPSLPPR